MSLANMMILAPLLARSRAVASPIPAVAPKDGRFVRIG